MKEQALSNLPNRRSFLLAMSAAGLLPVLPEASAQSTGAVPSRTQNSESADPAEIDALVAMVTLRYGGYLQPSDMANLRRGMQRIRRSAAELLKVPIDNGDGPDCLFRPDGL